MNKEAEEAYDEILSCARKKCRMRESTNLIEDLLNRTREYFQMNDDSTDNPDSDLDAPTWGVMTDIKYE